MNTFDRYLLKKDKLLSRRVEIDSTLYEKLEQLADIYDASINKLVNIAIIELVRTEKVEIYTRKEDEKTEPHNFAIREQSYLQLEKLKSKYGLSLFKLINIAIYNAINN